MAKVKATKPTKGASKVETPKKVAAVKEGRVTKASQTPKSKAKETAKAAASKSDKKSKKSKAPTPEPESDSDEEMTSDSSASSDSESDSDSASEAESKPAPKANGAAKKAAKKEASSDSSSEEDSDSSDSDAGVPVKANGTAKKAAAKDESSDSDSDSDSSEDEAPAPKKAVAKAESSDSDSDSDSASSEDEAPKAKKTKAAASDDSDSSSDSSDSDEESTEETTSEDAPSKKRKAETEAAPAIKKNKTQNAEGNGSPNLFVGNLSWNVDEDWLGREFEEYEPKAVRIVTDRATGRSKGFGYVEFETAEAATAALNAMKGAEIDSRTINLDYSTPRPEGQNPRDRANDRSSRFGDVPNKPSDTLFVGNLSFDATPDVVTELFQEYGTITRVSLPTKPEDGMPKGFGYVGFSSIEEAQGAFDALQGAELSGRAVRLDFAAPRSNDGGSRGSFGGRGGGRGGSRGGFGGRGGGRGGSGFGGRGGGRGGARGGRGGFSTNRGGFGDFQGKKTSFD